MAFVSSPQLAAFTPGVFAAVVSGVLTPEQMAMIRQSIPENHRYNIRYVISSIRDGSSGDADIEWMVGIIERLAVLKQCGVSPEEFLDAMKARIPEDELARMPYKTQVRGPRIFLRTANSTSTTPTATYTRALPTVASATPQVREEAPVPVIDQKEVTLAVASPSKSDTEQNLAKKPPAKASQKESPVSVGDKVYDKDPRRKRTGLVKELVGKAAVIEWQSGATTTISFKRLDRYKISRKAA